ncbi:hypothetical protein DRK59_26965 [Salmonella enterica subsp. diarizonae]|uniref:fimbrial protein n=1 Tax=Salmonella enterica TaxID=28901 RepID=UPI000FB6FB40|nr:hypothetical protein [Salmonella enterica]EDU8162831.1 fimbrial protein [Salmonella enterica subsp. diarizonae]EAQ6117179.1 hypothetical protein [Salmonella enterica]ECC6253453.1 fimbrial protein [Salmonella enterica]EEA3037083.1 fimbrial protein [Salmonella enterica subsp. diarizonae]
MTEWTFNLKTKLAVLVMMLCSFCVTKVYAVEPGINECAVTSGQNLNLRNINLTTDNFTPGPGSVISTVTQNVVFKCQSNRGPQRPQLVFNRAYFSNFTSTLGGMGLGLQLTITEEGQPSVFFSWDEIKGTGGGNELIKTFGMTVPAGVTAERSATIKLDFLYITKYNESSAVTTFPGISNVLSIVLSNIDSRNNGFILSGFNVKILRNNLGKVDIVPSLVNFGHLYTTWKPSQTKQADFTVRARQVSRPAPGQTFTIPLEVTFEKGALSTSDTTRQALNLTTPDGQLNGLQLSIRDGSGKLITFDEKEVLGDIDITSSPSGNVSKTYTAIVTPTPGGTVKTGKFSAAIPVIVTYN